MWYPTLSDVLDIYERVATHEGHAATISDPGGLDRVIVAPQRHGTGQVTAESLSEKAAAMYVMAVETEVFKPSTVRTAYVLVSEFLDRNGANFKASVNEMEDQFTPIAEGATGEEVTSWIKTHLDMRPSHVRWRQILGALDRLARTIEALEGVPGLERRMETIDEVGDNVCRAVASLPSRTGGREAVRNSFPAVHDRWGEAFGA